MLKAQDVADFFLAPSSDEEQITNLKLQKLLYYAQGYSLAMLGRVIFPEPIENWTHGPVVSEVYHTYKKYSNSPLPYSHIEPDKYSSEEVAILELVRKEKGQYSAWKLRDMTHEELPWLSSSRGSVISVDSIASFFREIKPEYSFNFDLERMERMVNDSFTPVPSSLSSVDEFVDWLKSK